MAEAPPLLVDHLTVRWRRGQPPVVDDLSFTAPAGSITVLLGPNGAGKSTALKAVLGLLPLWEGTVRLAGHDGQTLTARERARLCAYVPQHSALEAPLPVREVVAHGRYAHAPGPFARPGPAEHAHIESAMARTDTLALAERPFSGLSYGERRRVLLARALATGASVLLLDEPTAALDVGHALALLDVLREVARAGTAIVVVLHQLQEAAALADQALLLARGRCVRRGPAAEVIAPQPVRDVYGVEMVPAAQFACRLPGKGEGA
jgi:iron complex transport system ATP-binding protein